MRPLIKEIEKSSDSQKILDVLLQAIVRHPEKRAMDVLAIALNNLRFEEILRQ